MAESAIPNSGLGMYTAQAIPKGQRIFSGDVVVQVEDMDLNTKLRHWAHGDYSFQPDEDEDDDTDKWLLFHYYWEPAITLAVYEADDVQSIIPGLGMLANSHTALYNAEERAPRRLADLHRHQDPGTGAVTTYHEMHFDARHDIAPGTELFVRYGDKWFEDRTDELGDDIPLSHDFRLADRSVKKLWHILQKTKGSNKSEEEPTKQQNEQLITDALGIVKHVAAPLKRFAAAFPNDYDGFQQAVRDGTTATLSVPNQVRSLEWLDTHGQCLDNLRPDVSTIQQAGRGAFATRRIRQGDVIAPVPVVHIRRHDMEIRDADDWDNPHAEIWNDGTQLLLNYCYGHAESSLLLFPYSPVVNYVNHHHNNSNAELRWSSHFPKHHRADWFQRTPDELETEDHAGLILELVATRDIAAGEEVFLNYGARWESAWQEFVSNWQPPMRDNDDDDPEEVYVSAAELNLRNESLKTKQEQKTDPYPDHVFTVCFIDPLKKGAKGDMVQWAGSKRMFHHVDFMYPCTILERHDGHYYTVLLDEDDEDEDNDKAVTVKGVPRHAIQFFDHKYQSDNFLRNSFRHEIQLPDAMVPDAWRDLRQN